MKKKLIYLSVLSAIGVNNPVFAANDFLNGGFEAGTTSGWTTAGGTWSGTGAPLNPNSYTSAGGLISIVTSATTDTYITGYNTANRTNISAVFSGTNAVMVNNGVTGGGSVSVIRQSVTDYGGSYIYLAWLAVLEQSHGPTDSGHFVILVHDDTTNSDVGRISYSSATTSSFFTNVSGTYVSGWRADGFAVTSGHAFTVSLLAADCGLGGHWGYVYLDSFGSVAPTGLTPVVYTPSTHDIVGSSELAATLGSTLNPRFNGGALVLDGTAISGSTNFTITNSNGTINTNGRSATIGGVISNDPSAVGSLTVTNSSTGGTLTLSNVNTYTGTTTINSGATLALSGSGSIATSSGVVADGTLNVSDTNTGATITTLSGSGSVVTAANKGLTLSAAAGTFSGAISGAGGLTVAAGTETLSGTNTYTGTTTIDSGATLALSGSGSIATSSGVTNNGTLRVTAATGNIALGGTYTQSTGGSLLMNFSATNNQQINVSNTATLAGNLAITASAGTYNVGRYTLITASNGVSGTFNSFDGSSFSNLSADYSNYALGYDANNVYLNLYPTAANTQASIESNLASLRGAYNLANIAMNNNLNQDCSFFNEYGFCASLIGSHTSIAGSKDTDMTDGILVLAKKMDEHFRIGAYLDQTINIHNNSYVHLRNDGPGFGGFAVWNRQADGFGAQLRASAGRSSKDLSVTRQVVGNAEAGTGKTDFDSYGAAIVASYAVEATDDLNVTPYVGVRWTKVTADAYTEDSAAFAPLNFAALSQSATTLMGGLKVNKAINENAAAYASFALEQDIHNNGGSYSASSANIAGITPVAFNQDINKVRPVVNAGTQYNIDRRQRIGADVIWSEQAFTKNDSTTLMVRYTLGL